MTNSMTSPGRVPDEPPSTNKIRVKFLRDDGSSSVPDGDETTAIISAKPTSRLEKVARCWCERAGNCDFSGQQFFLLSHAEQGTENQEKQKPTRLDATHMQKHLRDIASLTMGVTGSTQQGSSLVDQPQEIVVLVRQRQTVLFRAKAEVLWELMLDNRRVEGETSRNGSRLLAVPQLPDNASEEIFGSQFLAEHFPQLALDEEGWCAGNMDLMLHKARQNSSSETTGHELNGATTTSTAPTHLLSAHSLARLVQDQFLCKFCSLYGRYWDFEIAVSRSSSVTTSSSSSSSSKTGENEKAEGAGVAETITTSSVTLSADDILGLVSFAEDLSAVNGVKFKELDSLIVGSGSDSNSHTGVTTPSTTSIEITATARKLKMYLRLSSSGFASAGTVIVPAHQRVAGIKSILGEGDNAKIEGAHQAAFYALAPAKHVELMNQCANSAEKNALMKKLVDARADLLAMSKSSTKYNSTSQSHSSPTTAFSNLWGSSGVQCMVDDETVGRYFLLDSSNEQQENQNKSPASNKPSTSTSVLVVQPETMLKLNFSTDWGQAQSFSVFDCFTLAYVLAQWANPNLTGAKCLKFPEGTDNAVLCWDRKAKTKEGAFGQSTGASSSSATSNSQNEHATPSSSSTTSLYFYSIVIQQQTKKNAVVSGEGVTSNTSWRTEKRVLQRVRRSDTPWLLCCSADAADIRIFRNDEAASEWLRERAEKYETDVAQARQRQAPAKMNSSGVAAEDHEIPAELPGQKHAGRPSSAGGARRSTSQRKSSPNAKSKAKMAAAAASSSTSIPKKQSAPKNATPHDSASTDAIFATADDMRQVAHEGQVLARLHRHAMRRQRIAKQFGDEDSEDEEENTAALFGEGEDAGGDGLTVGGSKEEIASSGDDHVVTDVTGQQSEQRLIMSSSSYSGGIETNGIGPALPEQNNKPSNDPENTKAGDPDHPQEKPNGVTADKQPPQGTTTTTPSSSTSKTGQNMPLSPMPDPASYREVAIGGVPIVKARPLITRPGYSELHGLDSDDEGKPKKRRRLVQGGKIARKRSAESIADDSSNFVNQELLDGGLGSVSIEHEGRASTSASAIDGWPPGVDQAMNIPSASGPFPAASMLNRSVSASGASSSSGGRARANPPPPPPGRGRTRRGRAAAQQQFQVMDLNDGSILDAGNFGGEVMSQKEAYELALAMSLSSMQEEEEQRKKNESKSSRPAEGESNAEADGRIDPEQYQVEQGGEDGEQQPCPLEKIRGEEDDLLHDDLDGAPADPINSDPRGSRSPRLEGVQDGVPNDFPPAQASHHAENRPPLQLAAPSGSPANAPVESSPDPESSAQELDEFFGLLLQGGPSG
ncbi:unnamed protein product [Amoebophrya sp. A25]|nr:unnamed protein product [Amoebophrya sp. A25]|eukprot:GSA25T00011137001.1